MKTSDIQFAYWDSPVGCLEIGADENFLRSLRKVSLPSASASEPLLPLQAATIAQLDEYFKGLRRQFCIPCRQGGTPFQEAVWAELLNIPYGQCISYAELGARVGQPLAHRAVGNANGKNRICIIVPCHRVIMSSGKVGGYAYGAAMKTFLLDMEKRIMEE